MAKGLEFVDALKAAIAPSTIVNTLGKSDGVSFKLSDGRTIKAERKAIADLTTADDLAGYVQRVIS